MELGIRHGAWCLGCCWALMAALFAVGVMSVGSMALIAAFIAAERLLPWPNAARAVAAVVLLALGLGVALAPSEVPGFNEPSGAMQGGERPQRVDADALNQAVRSAAQAGCLTWS